jgi:hypothetical protein
MVVNNSSGRLMAGTMEHWRLALDEPGLGAYRRRLVAAPAYLAAKGIPLGSGANGAVRSATLAC